MSRKSKEDKVAALHPVARASDGKKSLRYDSVIEPICIYN